MEKKINTPESILLDTLYDLQFIREVSGKDVEPAVMGSEVLSECNILIDSKTNDRIVTSILPNNPDDFTGATVWISNPDVGVAIDAGKWQSSPYNVIFWIDKALQVRYFNLDHTVSVDFDADCLVERLSFPNIIPVAQSEYDLREIPNEIENLSIPQVDSYTTASRIIDSNQESNKQNSLKRFGIIEYDVDKSTTFDIALYEKTPEEEGLDNIDFEREFKAKIQLGQSLIMPVIPWGQPEIMVSGRDIEVRILRGGVIIKAFKDGKEINCIPSKMTQKFFDNILENASRV